MSGIIKSAKLLAPIESKGPGAEAKRTMRQVGTRCRVQRHSTDAGAWVIWFGKEYAVVPALRLMETVEFTNG